MCSSDLRGEERGREEREEERRGGEERRGEERRDGKREDRGREERNLIQSGPVARDANATVGDHRRMERAVVMVTLFTLQHKHHGSREGGKDKRKKLILKVGRSSKNSQRVKGK